MTVGQAINLVDGPRGPTSRWAVPTVCLVEHTTQIEIIRPINVRTSQTTRSATFDDLSDFYQGT